VPRAELFKLPPPKAQLVRLPWKVGSLHRVVMPYNIEVTGRYKGVLSSEAKLPKNGNALGDTNRDAHRELFLKAQEGYRN
jgi:hypothetical protein